MVVDQSIDVGSNSKCTLEIRHGNGPFPLGSFYCHVWIPKKSAGQAWVFFKNDRTAELRQKRWEWHGSVGSFGRLHFWATSLAYLPWWSTASHQMRVFALQLPAIQTSKNLHTVCQFPARVGPLWGNPLRHRFSSWVFSGQLWTANKKLVKFCQSCTKYCNQLRIKLFAGYIYIYSYLRLALSEPHPLSSWMALFNGANLRFHQVPPPRRSPGAKLPSCARGADTNGCTVESASAAEATPEWRRCFVRPPSYTLW